MSNAIEFISAFNIIDSRMRAIYRGKGNLQFSDLVRRCAEFQMTIRKYEEDLLLCARLRNVIVHESRKDRIIAEPCDELTRLICHVAELLQSPPQLSLLKPKKVTFLSSETELGQAIEKISKTNYSNLPVYRGKRMIGIINNRRVLRELGDVLAQGRSADAWLSETPVADILAESDLFVYYKYLGKKDSLQEIVDAFEENRKLLAVCVSENGRAGERIVNFVTSADLPRINKLLEDYQ